jgi:uncharacterized Ntn-hydrolase superfamily protein
MTFSMVARCRKTLTLGVCVSTAVSAVGRRVPHVEAGVGAIATQAFTNIFYGIEGLKMLKAGSSPKSALEAMLKEDPGRQSRQIIMIDNEGRSAAFTGKETVGWKGHLVGKDYVVAGNMLVSGRVIEAMARTFENSEEELAERLLKALEAGQETGGDKRGRMSAALLTANQQRMVIPRVLDLRVDEHQDPVNELRRIFERKQRS